MRVLAAGVSSSKRVAIIGAGPGGLKNARECLRQDLQIKIFEQGSKVGGTWVLTSVPESCKELKEYHSAAKADKTHLTDSGIHSSLYESLRTNVPREIMGFPDYPFTRTFPGSSDTRRFPSHSEALKYFEAYAKEYDLMKHVAFETKVTRVEYSNRRELGWDVETTNNNTSQVEKFDAVIVCTSHHTIPFIPNIPFFDKFEMPSMHSHLYRNPEVFKDKRVVVYGNGPSGIDIAVDIGTVAKKVYVCARSWEDVLKNPSKPFESDTNVIPCANIKSCTGKGNLELADGTSLTDLDVMVFCTGYQYDFPFLKPNDLVTTKDKRLYPVYKRFIHPKYPTSLFFIDMTAHHLALGIIHFQAQLAARMISGTVKPPVYEEMMAEIERTIEIFASKEISEEYDEKCALAQLVYTKDLAKCAGKDVKDPEEWKTEHLKIVLGLKKIYPATFRDVLEDDSYFESPVSQYAVV
eukprot:g6829.t1